MLHSLAATKDKEWVTITTGSPPNDYDLIISIEM